MTKKLRLLTNILKLPLQNGINKQLETYLKPNSLNIKIEDKIRWKL